MNNKTLRVALVALDGFLGVTALIGALFVVPTMPVSYLSFFPDYTVPAIALGAVGVVALGAAVSIAWKPACGAAASVVAGGMIAFFEIVEALTAGNLLNPPAGTSGGGPLWLQPFFFVVGSIMVILGLRLWVRVTPQESWPTRMREAMTF